MDFSTVIGHLYDALLDKEVAAEPELYEICLQAKKELDKNESESIVFTRLSHSLSWYLMCHEYKMPKSMFTLAMEVQKISQNYRSKVAWSQILGSLFSAAGRQ